MRKIDNPDIVAAILTSAIMNKFDIDGGPQNGDKITHIAIEKYKEVFNQVSNFAAELAQQGK